MVPLRSLILWLVLLTLVGCASTATRPLPHGDPGTVGIARLEPVVLGGVRQWVLIRGTDATTPLVLRIHGGPGQAEMAAVGYNAALEQDFVVVEWDQRGSGKSASAADPASGMTLEQIADDTVELTRLLLARFHKSSLILVGHSWGSVVGLRAVQKAPQLYAAFVTTGLIADTRAGWAETYRWLTDEAVRTGNTQARAQLAELGPPPYTTGEKRAVFGRWIDALGASWHAAKPLDRTGLMVAAPEYSWPEKLGFTAAADRSFTLLGPDLAAVDLKAQVPRIEVPLFVAEGRFDHLAPTDLARAWYDALQAPHKVWRWFEGSAHFPQYEEADAFERFIEEVAQESGAQ